MAKIQDVGFMVSIGRTPTPQQRFVPRHAPTGTERQRRAMQVKISASVDEWHRPLLNPRQPGTYLLKTRCNQSFAGRYYATRDETYTTGELCPTCFTPAERDLSAEFRAEEETRQQAESERLERERVESMERAFTEIRERNRRLKTGQTQPIPTQDPDGVPEPDEEPDE